jgi:hypothetical protein
MNPEILIQPDPDKQHGPVLDDNIASQGNIDNIAPITGVNSEAISSQIDPNIQQVADNNPNPSTLASSSINSVVPQNTSSKGIFLLIGLAVVVVIVIAVYFILFFNKSITTLGLNGKTVHIQNTASSVESQFMTDIIDGNMKGAYGLTSAKFMSATSEANFAINEKYLTVSQLNISNPKLTTSKKVVVVGGSITAHGIHIFTYSSRMVKQGGIWKVDNIVIQS